MRYTYIVIIVILGIIGCNESFKEPKIGEVWRWRPRSSNKNPFKYTSTMKPYYDYKVIDVKEDYVLYMDLSDSSIESSSIDMFMVSSKCLISASND